MNSTASALILFCILVAIVSVYIQVRDYKRFKERQRIEDANRYQAPEIGETTGTRELTEAERAFHRSAEVRRQKREARQRKAQRGNGK